MASSPIELDSALGDSSTDESARTSVLQPISGVAFWAAVALPFLHLPLLFATGLSSQSTTTAFVTLLVLNVVALLLGHPHLKDGDRTTTRG